MMAIYIAILAAVLIAGQAGATRVPSRGSLIAGWLAGPSVMAALASLLDRRRQTIMKQAL
jgi:hypothetical protein